MSRTGKRPISRTGITPLSMAVRPMSRAGRLTARPKTSSFGSATTRNKWSDSQVFVSREQIEKEEETKHKLVAWRILQKMRRKDRLVAIYKEKKKQTHVVRQLRPEEKLRKFVAQKVFDLKRKSQFQNEKLRLPDPDTLEALHLWRMYNETKREGREVRVLRTTRPPLKYTTKPIIDYSLKLYECLGSFEAFLRILYPKHDYTDEQIQEIVQLAKGTYIGKHFIDDMYQVFLSLDENYASRVDLHLFIETIEANYKFKPYCKLVKPFLATVRKQKVGFPKAVVYLLSISKDYLDEAKEVFMNGFELAQGLDGKTFENYKTKFQRYDADNNGIITLEEMETHLM